ncbi:MAG: HipA N-terminal domain-containing protein [Oscillospiraceae bacterium]
MSTFRTAFVFVRNVFAGTLSETDEGYTFAYDGDYLKSEDASAVSLTLPLSNEPYSSKTLFSFFDGLIPEGWLLDVITRNWKVDRKDRFGLLLVSCRDAIGNVSIRGEKL